MSMQTIYRRHALRAARQLRRICMAATGVCAIAGIASAEPYRLPGGAAEYADPYIAAGFRALFTCSAHFAMQRPLEDILKVELADTASLGLPAPVIDHQLGLVRAGDGLGHTVTAVFRDTMGCTVLPPDWRDHHIPSLPYVSRTQRLNDRNLDYPLGDRVNARPNGRQKALIDSAFDGTTFGDGTLTAGIVIIRNGKVVAEQYRDGFGPHQGYRTWSTAKSITASLIGIAAGDGSIDIEASVPLPQWSGPGDPRAAITWQHLLWMSSGLWSKGSNTYALYFAGQDAESSAATTPLEAEPGKRWKYANNDTLLLLLGLREVLNDDLVYLRYPYDRLLDRIGMHHTWMESDHQGNFIGSSQVYTTARDLGRFGLLYLNDGIWAGERILPEGWTEFVSHQAPAFETRGGYRGYGAQFWLFGGVEGLPDDVYTTVGNKGQYTTILPSQDMVVVRTGVDPLGARWNQPRFVRQVIDLFRD
jgi:CubicO group peptidase (beta-lactamase class C family)